MTWATDFFKNLKNPPGNGNSATFDGAPVRVTFYSNTTYIADGFVEDPVLVKQSWRKALTDGHEVATTPTATWTAADFPSPSGKPRCPTTTTG